ncbi:MAG: hypothetical protein LC650_05200, partial [Actinobacteria bacterium]|nr:hypothetical protein [Actinomycetota bacterium]
MGLFGGSKKIYVSSSIYNLAGDELDRPNFIKSSLFSAVMNPYDSYLGEAVVGSYLTGPGIMQRSFFNYAVRNDIAGLPTLDVSNSTAVDPDVVRPFIPIPASPPNMETIIQSAEITDGDYSYWAEQYMLVNHPSLVQTEWVADYNSTTNEITIQFESGSTEIFTPNDYSKNSKYVIAKYNQVVPSEPQPLVVGTKITDVYSTPSTVNFTLESTVNTGVVDYNLNQTVHVLKEYDNGDPDVEETTYPTITQSHNGILETWKQDVYIGSTSGDDNTSTEERWLYIWERREKTASSSVSTTVETNDIGGGVTETVTTTTTTHEALQPVFDHQLDTQETIHDKIEVVGIWIYKIGDGNTTLDAIVSDGGLTSTPDYYPFIPIRLDNNGIRESQFASLYEESKKAYKRATGGPMKGNNIDSIIDEVEANEDIGDIDYSYIQWGVSVNVFDPACRRYMYEWFKNQIPYQNTSPSTMTNYENTVNDYEQVKNTYDTWLAAQSNSSDPLYNTTAPPKPAIGDPPSTTVRLKTDHPQLTGFDNRFTWVNITETTHTGTGKPGASGGDIWWENAGTLSWDSRQLDKMELYKQTTDTSYTKITVWGMVHENYIYGGKAVRTTLKEGVNDEAESVFIVPLHAPTVKSLGVKDFTQMSLSNTFITFNSYEVVKKKWYQTFLGMLFIVIAIVVVAALIAPAAVGGATGVFGTNAAVGGALGLSGTAAIVAGAVTNAIAAVVIAQAVGA